MKTASPRYSIVIPVYNSEKTVAEVVGGVSEFFQKRGDDYEIILVNDGSQDQSWKVLTELHAQTPRVTVVQLLKNYGQHHANLCGFRIARGEFMITLDDDLQNPPDEIEHLIQKAEEGHDLVMGRFSVKKHGLLRRLGSKIIGRINVKVFGKPPWLVMTNFRLIHRRVIDRVISFRGPQPYIPGLVVLYAKDPANVEVRHLPREHGKSQYGLRKLLSLVFSLLFSYSIYPLRMMVTLGVGVSAVSFLMSAIFVIRGLLGDVRVPGWTTIVTLISFFSGFMILLLGVLGEYVINMTRSISHPDTYVIDELLTHEP